MASAADHDFIIRGGTVIDGSGRDAFTADIAVRDGHITHVGPDPGSAGTVYDADGLVVMPGFVDIHTHFDGQATWDSRLVPSSEHGVTTAVAGNCGVGFAPAHADGHQRLIDFMEGVEDIPGAALDEGISWDWESFGEYLGALERVPHDIDLGVYVPHCPVRIYVMGDRARAGEVATEEEIDHMAALVHDAVLDGALGFSTSRTINHRTVVGEHIPTLTAAHGELVSIASAMGETGRGLIQLTTDFKEPDDEFAMLRDVAVRSGRPVSFSLIQDPQFPDTYRKVLDLLATARSDRLPMSAQVPVRGVGLVMGLDATLNPFSRNPAYQAISDLPVDRQLREMRTREFRERLVSAHAELHRSGRTAGRLIYAYERIFELGDPPNYEPGPSSSVAARAVQEGRDAAEVMYDILTSGDGNNLLYAFITNLVPGSLDIVHELLLDPNTIVGLSDAGAHVGMIADGSFPTTLLAHWGVTVRARSLPSSSSSACRRLTRPRWSGCKIGASSNPESAPTSTWSTCKHCGRCDLGSPTICRPADVGSSREPRDTDIRSSPGSRPTEMGSRPAPCRADWSAAAPFPRCAEVLSTITRASAPTPLGAFRGRPPCPLWLRRRRTAPVRGRRSTRTHRRLGFPGPRPATAWWRPTPPVLPPGGR